MAERTTRRSSEKNNALFWLVLLYVIIFYVQPGDKVPALGAVRIELLIGVAILAALVMSSVRNRLIAEEFSSYVVFFIIAMLLSFLGAVWTHTATDAWPVLIKLLKLLKKQLNWIRRM